MGKGIKHKQDDNSIDNLLQKAFGYSDVQLLQEFENAKGQQNSDEPTDEDEFERIMASIEAEEARNQTNDTGIRPMRRRMPRIVKVLLVACFMVTFLGCIVVVGQKAYYYRESKLNGIRDEVVWNNDEYMRDVGSLKDAYLLIEKELDIKLVRIGYMPYDLIFSSLEIRSERAKIEFDYQGNKVYYVVAKRSVKNSEGFKSDRTKNYRTVYNKWIKKDIDINGNKINDNQIEYEAEFVDNGNIYRFFGIMNESMFVEIIENMSH